MNFFILFALSALSNSAIGNVLKSPESPSSLASLATYSSAQLFPFQRTKTNHSLPIVTYSKLKNKTLEVLGAEFISNIRSKLNFIAYLLQYFPVNNLVFKDFSGPISLPKILPYLNSRLKCLVKEVSFENCIIVGDFSPTKLTALKNVKSLMFMNCITTQNDLNEFFKCFSASLTALIFKRIHCEEDNFSSYESDAKDRIPVINVSLLELNMFPKLEHLFFSGEFDLKDVDFKMFECLETLSLEQSSSISLPLDNLSNLPPNLKLIKTNCPEKFIRFINDWKLVDKKIHIESSNPVRIRYELIKSTPEFLLIFKSFDLFISSIDLCIGKLFSLLTANKSNLSHITRISIVLDLSREGLNQLSQLIEFLPGLQSLELLFTNAQVPSIQLPLFNGLSTAIKDLTIYCPRLYEHYYSFVHHNDNNEDEATEPNIESKMSSVVCNLLRIMPELKSLNFLYEHKNMFIGQLLKCESLPLINLDKYTVTYISNGLTVIQNDLELARRFGAKQLIFNNQLIKMHATDNIDDSYHFVMCGEDPLNSIGQLLNLYFTRWLIAKRLNLVDDISDIHFFKKFGEDNFILRRKTFNLFFFDSIDNLNAMEDLSIKKITLDLYYLPDYSNEIIQKLIEKIPCVEELEISRISHKVLTVMNLQNLRYLRKISITGEFTLEEVQILFNIFPLQIQEVILSACIRFKDSVLELFHERFPNVPLYFNDSS